MYRKTCRKLVLVICLSMLISLGTGGLVLADPTSSPAPATTPAIPDQGSTTVDTNTYNTGTPNDSNVAATYLVVFFQLDQKSYRVNDQVLAMDGTVIRYDNRIYVPVRYLAMSLGVPEAGIQYNPQQQTVMLQTTAKTIKLKINDKNMDINGVVTAMDVAPMLTDNRVYLPARPIAQALGYDIEWSDFSNSVIVGTKITFGSGYYLGDMINGVPDGQGVYYNPTNGNRYMGEFQLGHGEGNGIFQWADGNIYEGQFANDRRSGWGIMYYSSKDYYFGQWENDLRHGWGKYVYANGTVQRGMWESGQFIGPSIN